MKCRRGALIVPKVGYLGSARHLPHHISATRKPIDPKIAEGEGTDNVQQRVEAFGEIRKTQQMTLV